MAPRTFVIVLAGVFLVGCVGVHREIRLQEFGDGPLLPQVSFPVEISGVKVAEGADIYWQPAFLRVLPMKTEPMRKKVSRILREELDRGGFRSDGRSDHWLEVTIEEISLLTRGGVDEGYREGYAEMRFRLRSSGETVVDQIQVGEIRYDGSGVRESENGTFFRPQYIYEDPDPDPVDHAIRQATRRFLLGLPPRRGSQKP